MTRCFFSTSVGSFVFFSITTLKGFDAFWSVIFDIFISRAKETGQTVFPRNFKSYFLPPTVCFPVLFCDISRILFACFFLSFGVTHSYSCSTESTSSAGQWPKQWFLQQGFPTTFNAFLRSNLDSCVDSLTCLLKCCFFLNACPHMQTYLHFSQRSLELACSMQRFTGPQSVFLALGIVWTRDFLDFSLVQIVPLFYFCL